MENDELKIYFGDDYVINDYVHIRQPTLYEISEYGEQKYFSLVYNLTATPTDLKYQLSLADIDWNTKTDYEVFLMRYKMFTKDFTWILLGDLDLSSFEICINKENDETILYNAELDATVDRFIYELIVDYVRTSHNLKKNVERAMNRTTREVLLEEAKEQFEAAQKKPYHSVLKPLISTMTNMDGFGYNWSNVREMKINAFMDAVTSIMHIKNVNLLLQSGYSGFGIDLSKIGNKKKLDYFSRPSED